MSNAVGEGQDGLLVKKGLRKADIGDAVKKEALLYVMNVDEEKDGNGLGGTIRKDLSIGGILKEEGLISLKVNGILTLSSAVEILKRRINGL